MQIDIDPKLIGMRYPYEINMVADCQRRAAGADPAPAPQGRPFVAGRRSRPTWRAGGRPWTAEAMINADLVNPLRVFYELSSRLPRQRDRDR